MRHTFQVPVVMVFLSVAAVLAADNRLSAAEQAKPGATPVPSALKFLITKAPPAAAAKPAPQHAAATMEKLRNLGAQLRRALDIAVDLFSGNEADLLSKNKTALLSGNSPRLLSGNEAELLAKNKTALLSGNKPAILSGNKTALLSGNKPAILSGNSPKVLSENTTPIFSGNKFSLFSNIKIEIHIINSGDNNRAPAAPGGGFGGGGAAATAQDCGALWSNYTVPSALLHAANCACHDAAEKIDRLVAFRSAKERDFRGAEGNSY